MARFNIEKIDWNDLRLFLAVARAGGLAPATSAAGVSPATLGRRILSLEQKLGAVLFERKPEGYYLTQHGHELIPLAEKMEQGALDIDRWRAEMHPRPTVSITAGAWTSSFISRHSKSLIKQREQVGIEILTNIAIADLAHREANLGIRSRRPYRSNLTGQRLGLVAFSIYGAPSYVQTHSQALDYRRYEHCEWITSSSNGSVTPSAAWLERHLQRPAIIRCSDPISLINAVVAGEGLCVLPCFIGDADSRLIKVSEAIEELHHEQWLVSHEDDSGNQWVQKVSRRLKTLFLNNRKLFGGVSQPICTVAQ